MQPSNTWEFPSPIPGDAFPSRGPLDVDGLFQQEFPRSPGPVNHRCVLPVDGTGNPVHRVGLLLFFTKVKDALLVEKQANVAYWIPCSCGKAYIGETKRRLESRLREYQDACQTQSLLKSAVAEHAWGSHHPINWKDTSVIDWARRPEELLLKEAIHIQRTPAGERINRDRGREFPSVGWLH